MLAELILALCASAKGEPAVAVKHADSAFVFAAVGSFRDSALLFVRWLDDDARAERCAAGLPALVFNSFVAAPQWIRLPEPAGMAVIPRIHSPDVDEVRARVASQQPFVASGMLEAWPARERWASLQYFDNAIGHRLVPVEVGAAVDGPGWREEFMPLGQFLREHLAPSCSYCASVDEPPEVFASEIAYVAQHELLEQCPALRSDVSVPEPWRRVLGRPMRTNVWLGTHGTLTPCHWDSYENFLAQVHGSKRAILLAPEAAKVLYVESSAGAAASQGNVSPVNVEKPDLTRFPEFARAQPLVADLSPGDALFIPQGWWHQLRALSPSVSVNFWF